jgi:alpha/beta superfamily hydrolase
VVVHWYSPHAPSVILCPGLLTKKDGPSFMLSAIARQVYQHGMNVFQFDYFGEGDSDGEHDVISMISLFNSAELVVEFAKEQGCSKLGLVGLGIGNIIISYLSKNGGIAASTLLFPDFKVIAESSEILFYNKRFCNKETICINASDNSIKETKLFQLWKAITGSHYWVADGAISIELLVELSKSKAFEFFLTTSTPTLIIPAPYQKTTEELLGVFNALRCVEILNFSTRENETYTLIKSWDKLASWLSIRLGTIENKVVSPFIPATMPENDVYSMDDAVKRCTFSCESGNQQILGVLHVPSSISRKNNSSQIDQDKKPCVIYLHGLGGDRVDVYRCGFHIGNELARKGVYLLRYDCLGAGVSAGNFFETTWSKKLEILDCMINKLTCIETIDINRIALIAFSSGARLACLAANRMDTITSLVLLSPELTTDKDNLFEGSRFFRHSTGKLVLQYKDLLFGATYFTDARKYEFGIEFEHCQKPMLIVFGEQEESLVSKQFVKNIADQQSEKKVVNVCGGHTFSYHSMREVVIISTSWLADLLY